MAMNGEEIRRQKPTFGGGRKSVRALPHRVKGLGGGGKTSEELLGREEASHTIRGEEGRTTTGLRRKKKKKKETNKKNSKKKRIVCFTQTWTLIRASAVGEASGLRANSGLCRRGLVGEGGVDLVPRREADDIFGSARQVGKPRAPPSSRGMERRLAKGRICC